MKDDASSNSSTDPSPPERSSTGVQNLIIGFILSTMVLLLLLLIAPNMIDKSSGGGTSKVDKLREELDARKKALSGTNGPTGGDVSPHDLASRLATDSARLAELVTELQANMGALQRELRMSQTTVHSLSSQLATRTGESAENTGLRQQLDSALKRADTAELQLRSLQQQFAGAPTAAQMDALLKERDNLRSKVSSPSKPLAEPEAVNDSETAAP